MIFNISTENVLLTFIGEFTLVLVILLLLLLYVFYLTWKSRNIRTFMHPSVIPSKRCVGTQSDLCFPQEMYRQRQPFVIGESVDYIDLDTIYVNV